LLIGIARAYSPAVANLWQARGAAGARYDELLRGPNDPTEKIPQGDLDTAEVYGKRIREVATSLSG
jgi:hypothetical protein